MTEGTLLYFDPFVFKNAMGSTIQNLGVLKPELLADLKACLKQASNIKRKYVKWL